MAADESADKGDGAPKLRGLLVGGDYFLATVVATTLTKLALRSRAHLPLPAANMVAADVMLILAGMLQMGKAGQAGQAIDTDSQERLTTYLHLLSSPGEDVQQLCLVHCHQAFSAMLSERASLEEGDRPAAESVPEVNRQADDLIVVRQLKGGKAETAALADRIAGKLGAAVRIGKQAFYTQLAMETADAYAYTGGVMVENLALRDTDEGMQAFIEKRAPDWKQ
jgi:coatomer subunit beta